MLIVLVLDTCKVYFKCSVFEDQYMNECMEYEVKVQDITSSVLVEAVIVGATSAPETIEFQPINDDEDGEEQVETKRANNSYLTQS